MHQQFYFKINLNKFGDIKIQAEKEKKTFINAIVVFVIALIALCAAAFYINQKLDAKIENRSVYLEETEAQLRSFQSSGDYLSSNDLDRLTKTFTNRIFWARKMVALSAEINDKLAVRKFTYSSGILTLNGITPVDKNVKELDLINSFIDRLKANPEISNDFPDIKSGLISKQTVKDTDILEFVIECYSKETGGKK